MSWVKCIVLISGLAAEVSYFRLALRCLFCESGVFLGPRPHTSVEDSCDCLL